MIAFEHVTKQFGTQVVLADASFQVNPGERVGVVGPNGAGKSTVFNLIVSALAPDKGDVRLPAHCRIGYVHQQLNAHAVPATLLEYAENALPELQAIQTEIHALEEQLQTENPTTESVEERQSPTAGSSCRASVRSVVKAPLLRRLGELQTRFEQLGGYTLHNRAERTLSGLGFPVEWFSLPFRTLSGGWQSRAELARVLVAEPAVLLLDEPSNYLDIPSIEWLHDYLDEFKGTLLLISHDRYLLNSLCRATIEIANSRAERYPGNYDYYARERDLRYRQRLAAQKNQDRKREQLERFIERFKAKSPFATQAQSRAKQLARMEKIEIPRVAVSPGRIRLRPPPHCGAEVVRLDGAGISYDGQRWVLRGLDLSIGRGEKLALVGYNGLGKTTLLRMFAGNLPPTEGQRVLGHKVQIGYQSQDFAETMDPRASLFYTIKSTAPDVSDQEVRNLLGSFGFSGDAVEKEVGVLSGGEKIRLAFARLLVKPPNFLVLDEPTTHLDIQAAERLEEALQDYQGTICMVSHDIDFVRHVATGIIAMTPPGVTRYAGGYDYYHEKVSAAGVISHSSLVTSKKESGAKSTNDKGQMTNDKPDKKALRQRRAQERQALYSQTKDFKKAIHKAEKEVERLETEKAALAQQLSRPNEKADFAALNRRLQQLQYEIDIATAKWEQATEALEKVVGENSDANDG